MRKEIYKTDNNGFIVNKYIGNFNEHGILISPKGNYIIEPLPQPLELHIPRWNGVEWVEGETEEDRNKREYNEYLASLIPSNSEIANAKLEIKTIEILKEIGII